MNKAFVRESEIEEGRCPRCGSPGVAVGLTTIRSQLPPEATEGFPESAYYCAHPRCPVAYFDRLGQTAPAALLGRPAYPKAPGAPLCACTGLTAAELEEDFHAGDTARIKDLAARAQAVPPACIARAPDGRPCAAEARKLWMRFRGGA